MRRLEPSTAEEAERCRIVAALAEASFCPPGSIGDERTRCGKPRCRCKSDPSVLNDPYNHRTR